MTLGFLLNSHDTIVQDMTPAAADVFVTTKALTASPLGARALPAVVKPNHPNHRSPAPRTTIGTWWGTISCSPLAQAFAYDYGSDQGGHARLDVDHCASREVESAHRADPAVVGPYPVSQGRVDHCDPYDHEDEERSEPHTLGEPAYHDCGGDHGEHPLEDHERLMGYGVRVRPCLRGADA